MSTTQKIHIKTSRKTLLADTMTPIGLFLKIRRNFKNSVILESADYHGREHGFSHIAFEPIASFTLDQSVVVQKFPDGSEETFVLASRQQAILALKNFSDCFVFTKEEDKRNGIICVIGLYVNSIVAKEIIHQLGFINNQNKINPSNKSNR